MQLALVMVWRRRRWMVWRSWGECWLIWGVVGRRRGEMAAAGDGQLEAVDVESLLVSVRQQADEVVLLQAARVEVGVDERARSSRVHALLQPLGLQSNVHLVLPNPYNF